MRSTRRYRRPPDCAGGSRGARVAMALARGATSHDDIMREAGMGSKEMVAYGLDECEALGLITRERGKQGTIRPTFAIVVGPWCRP